MTNSSSRKKRCTPMGRSIRGGPLIFRLQAQDMADPLIMELVLNPYRCPFLLALSARTARVLPTFPIRKTIRFSKRGLLRNTEIYLTQQRVWTQRSLLDPTTLCYHETPIFQKTRMRQKFLMCRRRSRLWEKMLGSKGRVARSTINN